MPKYQMYFDTTTDEFKNNVEIDEAETLDGVMSDILYELRADYGRVLRGEGEPQVSWSGNLLDPNRPLPEQGVRPNDVLRVSTRATIG